MSANKITTSNENKEQFLHARCHDMIFAVLHERHYQYRIPSCLELSSDTTKYEKHYLFVLYQELKIKYQITINFNSKI